MQVFSSLPCCSTSPRWSINSHCSFSLARSQTKRNYSRLKKKSSKVCYAHRKSKLRFLWCVDSLVRPVGRPFALFRPCTAGWLLAVVADVDDDAALPLLKLRRSRLRFVLLRFVVAWGCLLKMFDVDLVVHTSSSTPLPPLMEFKLCALLVSTGLLLLLMTTLLVPLQHFVKRLFSLA